MEMEYNAALTYHSVSVLAKSTDGVLDTGTVRRELKDAEPA